MMKLLEWIGKLIGAVPREERQGIHLDTAEPTWEVEGPATFQDLFTVLNGWLPQGAILYFEGGQPDKEIKQFMADHAVQEKAHVAMGTILPRPHVFHLPASGETLAGLAKIMEHHAEPELAIHFHVYLVGRLLIEWYDAFMQPMHISGILPEEKIKILAEKIGKGYKMEKEKTP